MKIKSRHAKLVSIAAIITIGAIGSYLLYAYTTHVFPFSVDPYEHKVNYNRSEAEKQREQEINSNSSQKTENNQTDQPSQPTVDTTSGKQVASVLLTFVGVTNEVVSASGFVSNLSQDGGQCTYSFTKGDKSFEKTVDTMINPTSTTCRTTSFSASGIEPGVWGVILRYSSSNAEGESSAKELTIP